MTRRGRWIALLAMVPLAFLAASCGDEDSGNGTGPVVLSAPNAVQASLAHGQIDVTWSAVSGAASYTVQRLVVGSGGGFVSLASNLTSTSYTDTNVSAGNTYLYQVIAVADATQSQPGGPAEVEFPAVQPAVATLSGTITGTRQLSADTTYTLSGTVTVEDGGVLRIPAGTLILGDVTVQPSALIVRTGGQLFSEGTSDAPVVFTSSNPQGQRRRGDWGGVVLNGLSICNFPNQSDCVGEGSAGPYGGNLLDDNSGRVVYTRIEFAGYEVSFGNELNALTLNGVGSGTELHHIQTHYGSDDGFEFFGGTVDLKYAYATGISDDSFDYSTGWQGRGQFWILQQDPDDADNGWEVDGNEEDFNATPFTNPLIYNVTNVGKGPDGQGGTSGESTRGMLHRRGTAGKIFNAIVIGFGASGIDIDQQETVDRLNAGEFSIQNSIVFDNAANFDGDDDGIDEQALMLAAVWNNREVDPGLVDPYNRASPDFRPAAGSPALSGFATPPADGFFEPVDFIGGVDPNGTPWYAAWTTQAQN